MGDLGLDVPTVLCHVFSQALSAGVSIVTAGSFCRHCYSYDAIAYEGEEYGVCDEYAVEDDSEEQEARIRKAFSHLTATQQRRLRLYADGKTLREIAAIEKASFQSVSESIEAGRKKFLKFFCQTP